MTSPVDETQVAGFSARLGDQLVGNAAAPVGTLTVDDAVMRAVQHNQTIRARELEALLAEARARVQSGGMLPKLVAESSYYRRDRPQLSRSSQSETFSTSSDQASLSRELSLSWNIIDLGLSYIRGRQGADKAYQQHEETRRITNRIAEETRATYWRAVALQQLQPVASRLEREVRSSLESARAAAADPAVEPMAAVSFQRDILNLQRELNMLHAGIAGAEDQLRQLIGLQGPDRLRLSYGRTTAARLRPAEMAAEDVEIALRQRPEVRLHMYDLRITRDEATAALLQSLPGATFSRTFSGDSNSFLLNAHWVSWGAQIAGNLMGLVRLPGDLDVVERQRELHQQSALATAAAVVMQVHMSRARLAVGWRVSRDAQRFAEVQRDLLRQTHAAVEAGKASQQALVRERLATVLAEIRAIVAYADLEAAWAAWRSARGDDPASVHARSRVVRLDVTGSASRVVRVTETRQ